MTILRFPSLNSFHLALAGRAVPRRLWGHPVEAATMPDGSILLRFPEGVDLDSNHRLNSLGIGESSKAVENWITFSCWPEIIPPEKTKLTEGQSGPLLISIAGERAAALLAELRRWGRGAIDLAWSDDSLLIRLSEPPFHLLQRIEAGELDAYVEQSPRIWVRAGWHHPFASELEIPRGKCLYLEQTGAWRSEPSPAWQHGSESFTFQDHPRLGCALIPSRERSGIPLRWKLLREKEPQQATLWMLFRDAIPRLQALVRGMDERSIACFSFAVTKGDQPIVILMAIPGKESPILLDIDAEFQSILKLPNLFLPTPFRLHPPARRDIIRDNFAPDPKVLVLLQPDENGLPRMERIPLTAFRPLAERTAYFAAKTEQRTGWTRSGWMEFDRYVVRLPARPATQEALITAEEVLDEAETKPRSNWISRAFGWIRASMKPVPIPPVPAAEVIPQVDDAVRMALDVAKSQPPSSSPRLDEAEDRCRWLEIAFLEGLSGATPGEVTAQWPELAGAYHLRGRHSDAAICWLNSAWEQPELGRLEVWGWLRSEAASARLDPQDLNLKQRLQLPPSPALSRTLAASVVWASIQRPAPRAFLAILDQLQPYFEKHEADLPVRAAWLVRAALAQLTRGDVLTLARASDRLQERLGRSGLSLELDAPAFLRWAQSGLSGPFHEVRHWLSSRRGLIQKWITDRTAGSDPGNASDLLAVGLRAEASNTCAYADLMLAWGLARLGEYGESDRLSKQARKALPADSPVHSMLSKAFAFRIQQAEQGKLPSTPMPEEWQAALERLATAPRHLGSARYFIDRFRARSRILEPVEDIDPFWATTFRPAQDGDRRLLELPGLTGETLHELVRKLMDQTVASPQLLPILLPGVLRVANRLPPDMAQSVLDRLPRALDMVANTPSLQVPLLRQGLPAAAHFNQVWLVHSLAKCVTVLSGVKPGGSQFLEWLATPLLRSLRRTGLQSGAGEWWDRIAVNLLPDDFKRARGSLGPEWPATLRVAGHIAAGWYFLGRENDGQRLLDEVRQDLFGSTLSVRDQTSLALVYGSALAQVPTRQALIRFEELFQRLSDFHVAGSTNTYFTLQPLELIDILVTGLVTEDFTLGPLVRSWLDEDEFRVRKRIRSDLEQSLRAAGIV